MLHLNEKGVEVFMNKAKSEIQEPFWNNYDLIIWNKTPTGFTSKKGMFRRNAWGTAEKFSVDNQGIWKLPLKYVKHFR